MKSVGKQRKQAPISVHNRNLENKQIIKQQTIKVFNRLNQWKLVISKNKTNKVKEDS